MIRIEETAPNLIYLSRTVTGTGVNLFFLTGTRINLIYLCALPLQPALLPGQGSRKRTERKELDTNTGEKKELDTNTEHRTQGQGCHRQRCSEE